MDNDNAIITDVDGVNTQITYLWIEKYLNLTNQEINLGSPYFLKFDQNSKVLTVTHNENFIPDFFAIKNSGAKISNVSAIAGRNGSGKSTIFRFILDQFLDNSGGIDAKCILGILLNGKLKIYVNLPYVIEIIPPVDMPKLKPINLNPKIEPLKSTNRINLQQNARINVFDSMHADFVYVNPAFELKPQIDANLNRCDLSTNHFLETDFGRLSSVNNVNEREDENFETLINEHNRLINSLSQESDIDSQKAALMASIKKVHHSFDYFRSQRLERHAFSEIERIAKLISDYYDNPELMNIIRDHATIPQILTLKLQRNWVQDFKSQTFESAKKVDNIIELLQTIGTSIYIKHFAGMEKIAWQKRLVIETLLMLIYIGSRNQLNQLERIQYFKRNIESVESLDDLIRKLTEAYSEFLWLKPSTLQKNIESYIASIEMIEPCFTFNDDNIGYSEYNIKMSKPEAVSAFLKAYRELAITHGVFYFNWHAISTGEQNRLSLFARLHTLADKDERQSLMRNVFVLIDEGDLGYHPEWKRTFIDSLLVFLSNDWSIKNASKGFHNHTKRNIQIILTTNEPFLLSDIPSYSVTILGNNDIELPILECFGANINELYTRGFFIDSLIGEFAKKTIVNGLKLSARKNLTQNNTNEIRKLTQIIGEPIIAQSLSRKLNVEKHIK